MAQITSGTEPTNRLCMVRKGYKESIGESNQLGREGERGQGEGKEGRECIGEGRERG